MVSLSLSAARHLQLLLEEQLLEPLVETGASAPADLSQPDAGGYPTGHHSDHGLCGPVGKGLRVVVEKGGCAGLQYTMTLDIWRTGDTVVERDGVSVFIDSASFPYLSGAELDYCDDLVGTGFRLRNPNAVRSCGCGTSFEPSMAKAPSEGLVEAVTGGGSAGEVEAGLEAAG